jgi:serine/threonine-protein kinase
MADILDRLKAALADRYRIERQLGSGGMATVYLAEDLRLHRKVAVKVLRPELAAALGPERFLQEIDIAAKLNHPHILGLYDCGEAAGFLYYVMPYVEGESLRDRLNRDKQVSVDDALRIMSQIASALSYAHSRDIVHRDIKPENILIQAGEVVVADFGIALAVDSAGGTRLTETGFSLGTPAYMSPEQVSGEQQIDGRSDIYSLACVLYEMLAGDPPFVASSPRAVLAKHVTDPAPPITTVRSSVPQPVAAAITKALGKAPADRFESAKAFSEALFATEVEAEEEKKSIVVLPFDNRSPDPGDAYFSDGLTEEIITHLSHINSLRVISRNSAMVLKGSHKDTRTIAAELDVQYVLEGSVRKAGDKLRITAQLIDATSDAHVWAERYDGVLGDVFGMQEQVARSIVDALRLELHPREEERLAERPIEDLGAYECYLRARNEIDAYTVDGTRRAIQHLESALEIVGENVLLFTGMAYAQYQRANLGIAQEEAIALAEEYVAKALALDPGSPSALAVSGLLNFTFWGKPQEAVTLLKRALSANPNEPLALVYLGMAYTQYTGKTTAARWVLDRLAKVDPLGDVAFWLRGAIPFFEGDYLDASAEWRKGLEIEPGDAGLKVYAASAVAYGGDLKGALDLLADPELPEGDDVLSRLCRIQNCALLGDREGALRLITPPFRQTAIRDGAWASMTAAPLAFVGAVDEAVELLEYAVTRGGFINYPMLAELDPWLESIRGEDRFKRLMVRVKREWENFEV